MTENHGAATPYRGLQRPGAVIGDQIATDGVLASRLGYAFLHYCPGLPRIPPGPRLMYHLGRLVPSGLFAPCPDALDLS